MNGIIRNARYGFWKRASRGCPKDLKTADPRNSTCLATNLQSLLGQRVTMFRSPTTCGLRARLRTLVCECRLRTPGLVSTETHICWRMDEKFGVDSCTSCTHLQFRPRPDFGVGKRFSGLRTRGTHVLSPRHVLGLGTIRSGAAAQRNRPQHLRWQRRSVWWSERALQHVCSLHALRNA